MNDLTGFFDRLAQQLATAMQATGSVADTAKAETVGTETTIRLVPASEAPTVASSGVTPVVLPRELIDLRDRVEKIQATLTALGELADWTKAMTEVQGQVDAVAKTVEGLGDLAAVATRVTKLGEAVATHTAVLEKVLDRQERLESATAVRKSLDGQEGTVSPGAAGRFDGVMRSLVSGRSATLR